MGLFHFLKFSILRLCSWHSSMFFCSAHSIGRYRYCVLLKDFNFFFLVLGGWHAGLWMLTPCRHTATQDSWFHKNIQKCTVYTLGWAIDQGPMHKNLRRFTTRICVYAQRLKFPKLSIHQIYKTARVWFCFYKCHCGTGHTCVALAKFFNYTCYTGPLCTGVAIAPVPLIHHMYL